MRLGVGWLAVGIVLSCGRSQLFLGSEETVSPGQGGSIGVTGGVGGSPHGAQGGGGAWGGQPVGTGGSPIGPAIGGGTSVGGSGGVGAGTSGIGGLAGGAATGALGGNGGRATGGAAGAPNSGAAGALTGGEAGIADTAGEGGSPECTCPPRDPVCIDDSTLRRYSPGNCVSGGCGYAVSATTCLAGCTDGACAPFAASLAVGSSSACATVNGGPLKCWGENFNGAIGPTSSTNIAPTEVPGLDGEVLKVSVGTHAACALTSAGSVWCWGLGFSDVTQVTSVPSDIVDIACAAPYFDHTCVLTSSGGVKCWGSNNFGQLGNGATTESFTYQYEVVDVVGLTSGVTSITAGSNDTCAIAEGGKLWCWGMGRYGSLGNGSFYSSDVPLEVLGFESGTVAVDAGEEYTCAISSEGGVSCWGWGATGSGNASEPLTIDGVEQATAVSVDDVGCAVTSPGALKCWGTNAWNQLGTGVTGDSYTHAFDPVGMSAGVVAVAVGEYAACAVMETGKIRCWGSGAVVNASTPTDLAGF